MSLFHRADLVFDKNGINVTSVPPGDENGVVELCVQMGVAGRIELIIKNTGEDTITVQDITLLWSVNIFDYSEIRNVGEHNIQLVPGNFLFCNNNKSKVTQANTNPVWPKHQACA